MNMIDSVVGSLDGNAVLQTAGGALPVTHDMVSDNELAVDRAIAIGIRPEDIVIASGHGDGIHATIEVIESMGSGNVVYARLGSQRIAITTDPTYTANFDDPVSLTFDPVKTHLFDPGTEQVLTL